MSGIVDIGALGMATGYLLLLIPLAILLWLRAPILGQAVIAILRMTVQLLFVGFYLQVLFRLNHPWLNAAWILVMILVADLSILRGCELRIRRLALPLFGALLVGTAVPLAFFVGPIIGRPHLLDAQYAIPIGGLILGNCLRADLIGLRSFYRAIRDRERVYLQSLADGARRGEAVRPFLRDACQAALAPTVATMATVGLVALPGMMTGAVLSGADPMTAIKYQIMVMIAIFSGTAITVVLAILWTVGRSFDGYGVLDRSIFTR
jgi:putative ABC transport system permease protein